MTQTTNTLLLEIRDLLRELVNESRLRRVAAERASYNAEMDGAEMPPEARAACEARFKARCDAIMKGAA